MVQYVGILNITPDSFSDGGNFVDLTAAVAQARKLAQDGATIIDIGAQSTNPKSKPISIDEEWQRLKPVLEALCGESFQLSIDTFQAEIARRAKEIVPNFIINDVTMAHNTSMREFIAESGLTTILSHLPIEVNGDISAAHSLELPLDNAAVIADELLQRRDEIVKIGARKDQFILDPGIGFGKTMRLNAELVEFARILPEDPVMIGFSRKRFIEQFLGQDRFSSAVNADLAKKAIAADAAYLRVHEIPTHES